VLADPPSDLLAVYGTLRQGHRNHALVATGSQLLGFGHLSGTLLHITGPVRRFPYPGYLPGPSGSVLVEVLRITDEGLWPSLDALERFVPDDPDTSEYLRVPAQARLLDGRVLACWTYVYNRADGAFPTIADGDWASVSPPDVTSS
jgi:gamma-glutamylcyclotransferase (GGCT)/AIG2-like uncharacterized protein YtfP